MNTENVAKTRMRLRFARLERAAAMSHLDQIKALRNMAAASGLDVMPAGHGRGLVPKMAFGPALSQGHASRCEYADLYLAQRCKEEVVRVKLEAVMPPAFSLVSVKRVPVFFPSIEASVSAAGYLVKIKPGEELPRDLAAAFLAKTSAPYEQARPDGTVRTLDARPLVLGAELDAAAGTLRLSLRMEPGKSLKPEIALRVMAGRDINIEQVVREELYWLDSQGRLEVI